MAAETLEHLIERSIENKIIDAHGIDQDGSNVLIVGDEVHYCSDESARAVLAKLAKRAKAGTGGMSKMSVGPKPLYAAA